MRGTKKLDRNFFNWYFIGLVFTFLYGSSKLGMSYYPIWLRDILLDKTGWISKAILGFTIAYMFLLYIKARNRIKKNDTKSRRNFYKEYIQLEGYIQTLIGFFIAILSLVPVYGVDTPFKIESVASPIGIALMTSILGWYFGSDIAPPNEATELEESVRMLKGGISNLSDSLIDMSNGIRVTEKKYKESTDKVITNTNKLLNAQNDSITVHKTSLEVFKHTHTNYSTEVQQTLKRIQNDLDKYQVIYKKSLMSLNASVLKTQKDNQLEIGDVISRYFVELRKDVDKGLVAIDKVHDSYKKYLDSIDKGVGDASERLRRFMQNADKFNETIISNSETTNRTFKDIEKAISNVKKTALDDIINELANPRRYYKSSTSSPPGNKIGQSTSSWRQWLGFRKKKNRQS